MTDTKKFDFVVIGGGPAGQKAAIKAAKEGKRVALIERDRQIGGACVHRGTIPSKTLRESVMQSLRARATMEQMGIESEQEVQFSGLLTHLQSVIQAHSNYMYEQISRNTIEYFHGQAGFLDPHHVEIVQPNGEKHLLEARFVILATGTRPRKPDNIPVDHEHIYDSDSILSMIYVPGSITVLGAGVIATEYASILAVLGAKVTIVDKGSRPLGFLEPELSQAYIATLESFGGRYIGEQSTRSVEWDGLSSVLCTLESGEEIASEKVLFALGRVANIESLHLDNTRVSLTPRGLIEVDDEFRTSESHIYAVGDVIGPPALASTSMEQGRQAVCHALKLPAAHLARTIPIGIFTIPEMASVGLCEATALKEYGPVITGSTRFDEIARGHISGIQDGLLKLVVAADTGQILGVHIVGEGAAELIHIGQLAILKGMRVEEFVENIFNFPTLAEAYRVAALAALHQLSAQSINHNVHTISSSQA